METIVLTTPEVVSQTTTGYHIIGIYLILEPPSIFVAFRGTNGETREWRVTDAAVAGPLLTALSKANLSVKSLPKRIMEQAIADGVFAGTISGAPD